MEQDKTNTENISYNEAIKEIENIMKEMQSENCDIDHLAANTRRASQLIAICRQRLTRTEKEIQDILNNINPSAE